MRKAPWTDFAGSELYEGDRIEHPSGESGVIVFLEEFEKPSDQWLVDYGAPVPSRLCLQIGDRGRAVKAS